MNDPRVHWHPTNLRELGGYQTPHGEIRFGTLYRGGRMDELDAVGHATYSSIGLRTIIDLRRDDEVADAPTPTFGDEEHVHISVATGSSAFAEAAALADDPDGAEAVLATAGEYYRSLVVERLPLFRPVFDTILAADGAPVLFHCTAGKDRTGFVAAALLKFLDADDATVFEDYVLTNTVRKQWVDERVDAHRQRLAEETGVGPDEVAPASLEAWRALMSAPAEWLETTFAAVATEFGGDWHALRRDGLGIGDDRLAAWRQRIVA